MSGQQSSVTLEQLVAWLDGFHTLVSENTTYLTDLDAAIGDADHGTNMRRGMDAVAAKLEVTDAATIGELFKTVGMTLIGTVGGASGPLFGTLFLRIASSAGAVTFLDASALGVALRTALEGVAARGKADVGDKTMLDALVPAVDAFDDAIAAGSAAAAAAANARDAAQSGRDATGPMIARKGRASYLGDRSKGHLDPGSVSTALLFEALARALT